MTLVRSAARNARGIALVETLVATMVIAVGLVGLAAAIPVSASAVSEGQTRSTAAFLAEQRLEQVRNAAWTRASDCLGVSASTAPTSISCARVSPAMCTTGTACTTYPDEPAVPGYPSYRRQVRILDCDGTTCAGVATDAMRLVRVTVTHSPGAPGGSSGAAVLELVVARRH